MKGRKEEEMMGLIRGAEGKEGRITGELVHFKGSEGPRRNYRAGQKIYKDRITEDTIESV